jgi:hypothetical protein
VQESKEALAFVPKGLNLTTRLLSPTMFFTLWAKVKALADEK